MQPNFYECSICGNLVGLVRNGKGKMICCNQPMSKLEPNTVDAAKEKHVPVYEYKENLLTVTVGETEHPMLEEHNIEWICIMQNNHVQRQRLNVGEAPVATFHVDNIDNLEIYCYCNLHGLWLLKG